jgi:hypothetical protein
MVNFLNGKKITIIQMLLQHAAIMGFVAALFGGGGYAQN